MDFEPAIQAQIDGQTIRAAWLVKLDFLSGAQFVWNGFGPVVTTDGQRWEGAFGQARIEGVGQAVNGKAPEFVMTLSGVDPTFAAKVRDEAEEYYGRIASVFIQFFGGPDDDVGLWQCLGDKLPYFWGQMYTLKPSKKPNQEGDGFLHEIGLTVESPFAGRRRPRFSYYTDRDQQLRFDGDLGCSRVSGIELRNIVFPDY